MAKLVATDAAMKVTTDAVQVFGGVGYTRDYRVERYMREAKITQIFEGTNQIQRLVIARGLPTNSHEQTQNRTPAAKRASLCSPTCARSDGSGGDVTVTWVPWPICELMSIAPPIASNRASSEPSPMWPSATN